MLWGYEVWFKGVDGVKLSNSIIFGSLIVSFIMINYIILYGCLSKICWILIFFFVGCLRLLWVLWEIDINKVF